MKTLFQAYAKYNGNVNRELIELLTPLTEEKIRSKTKAFYPTIFDVFLHMCMTDAGWLKRYKDFFASSRVLSGSALLSADMAKLKEEFEHDTAKLYLFRSGLDDIISGFMSELTQEELAGNIKYTDYRGQPSENVMWKTLMYVFNHQTHYRGELSVMLDMADIYNDFSVTLTRI